MTASLAFADATAQRLTLANATEWAQGSGQVSPCCTRMHSTAEPGGAIASGLRQGACVP